MCLVASSESQITGSPQHIFLLHMSIHISHSYRQSSSTQLTNPKNKKQLIQAINFPNMNLNKSTNMRTAFQTLLVLDKLTQKLVLRFKTTTTLISTACTAPTLSVQIRKKRQLTKRFASILVSWRASQKKR